MPIIDQTVSKSGFPWDSDTKLWITYAFKNLKKYKEIKLLFTFPKITYIWISGNANFSSHEALLEKT